MIDYSFVDTEVLKKTAVRIIDNLLLRKDFMYYHVDTVHGIHYAEACTACAAMQTAGFLQDENRLQSLINRYSVQLSDTDAEEKKINTRNHVDVNVYGIVPIQIYKHTRDKNYLVQGLSLSDDQWQNPDENGLSHQSRFWIDDMFMIGVLQLQSYEISGDAVYLERAALTVNAYLKKLQKVNGLFFHGEDAPFFWGRGNGWCAAAMAQILGCLPSDHAFYETVKKGYISMMKTIVSFQGEGGMWNQLIDYKDAWSESSCTAMFAYAVSEGIRIGLLETKEYIHAVTRAWNALLSRIDNEGNLEHICAGTGQSSDADYYLNRPRVTGDLHGQAFMLWLIHSLLMIQNA